MVGVVGDVGLLADPLCGLRTWRVMSRDGPERLVAPQRATPWPSGGTWLQASCDEGHDAPSAGCRCGLHAWHPRPAFARRVLASRFDLPGIVEAVGRVEVHEDGFRAQRARPYAFVRLPGRNPYLIERLGAAYGAEILDLRRPDELLAVCTERHLGLPPAVVEELLGPETLAERRRARARTRRNAALRLTAALAVGATLGGIGATIEHTAHTGGRDLHGRAGDVHIR
jgi:hypothetical protein